MNKLKVAQYIALGATILTIVGLIAFESNSQIGGSLLYAGIIGGMISYIYGGFKTALRISVKIAQWGWIIIPFPYNIMGVVITFFCAITIFILVPIIPIRKAYKESLRA